MSARRFKRFLVWFGVLAALLAGAMYGAGVYGSARFSESMDAEFATALNSMVENKARAYTLSEVKGLPPVVRSYLEKAIPPLGRSRPLTELELDGSIILTEGDSWRDYTAKQILTKDPPGMLIRGETDYAPLVPLKLFYAYRQGRASMDSRLWGLASAMTQKGELYKAYMMLRWLGEAVWHPDALLPGGDVFWDQEEKIGERSIQARVHLTDGDIKVSGVFVFSSRGGAPLFFLADGEPFPELAINRFYCQYSNWRRMGDFQIPATIRQGVRRGITDDMRLRLEVKKISHR